MKENIIRINSEVTIREDLSNDSIVNTTELNSKKNKDLIINGIAINETITRNGVKYTAEELEASAASLVNKPMLLDHENKTLNIIGRVINASFDKTAKAITYTARVVREDIKQMIRDGLITNVSIGARVKDLIKEEKDGENYVVARGLDFLELSTTPVPGDAGATIAHALAENYPILTTTEVVQEKNKNSEEYKMSTETTTIDNSKVLAEKEAEIIALKKSLEEVKLSKLKEECKKLGIEESTLELLGEKELLAVSKAAQSFKVKENAKPITKGIVTNVQPVNENYTEYCVDQHTGGIFKMPNSKGIYK